MDLRSSELVLARDVDSNRFVSAQWTGLREAGLLRSVGRDPLILAFVSRLSDWAEEADLERVRAEVRGLGVTLLLLSEETVWCFEANDSLRKARAPRDVESAALRELFERFNVIPLGVDPAVPATLRGVFVIDSSFALRFAHVAELRPAPTSEPVRSTLDVLLRALVAASKAFEVKHSQGGRLSFSELTTLAVVAGMERVLAAPQDHTVAVISAAPPLGESSPAQSRPWSPWVTGGRHLTERAHHVTRPVSPAHGAT